MDGQERPLRRLPRRSMGGAHGGDGLFLRPQMEGCDCKRVFPFLLPKQSTARLHKADARIF